MAETLQEHAVTLVVFPTRFVFRDEALVANSTHVAYMANVSDFVPSLRDFVQWRGITYKPVKIEELNPDGAGAILYQVWLTT